MRGLMKRDMINYRNIVLSIMVIIPIGCYLTLPPFYISLGLALPTAFIGLFFADHQSNINRFLISLPLNRKTIVFSRYSSLFFLWIGIVLYQFGALYVMDYVLPYDVFTFSWKEAVSLFSIGLVMLAIFLPLFYMFTSFVMSVIVFIICYFGIFWVSLDVLVKQSDMSDEIIFNQLDQWVVPAIEGTITFAPFLSLSLLGLVLLFLSFKLSEKTFKLKSSI